MNKDQLLKTIAETGYNVGFGAKKHFATYDILKKAPGTIGLISITIGVFALIAEPLSSKYVSATLLVAGISVFYLNLFNSDRVEYDKTGSQLTEIFNALRNLYRDVQSGRDTDEAIAELSDLEQQFYKAAISNQVTFSDLYAHYKFFTQMQIEWIEEQKSFSWTDKFPISLFVWATIGLALAILLTISIFIG